jgi:hypothetical protein
MQQNFQNFETCEANAAAVQWCRRIASLEEEFDGPIVLQGGPQVGKSHLLWAIVEAVREGGKDAALVLISAQDFPDRVKSLVTRPAPIQTPRPALLLVDDLQEFDADAGDLEAVVECFLENGHNVVLATNISPQFLHTFSVGFRQLLTQGEKVVVGKRTAPDRQPGAHEPDVISRLRAECEAMHEERLALQQELEKHRTRAQQVETAEARMRAAEREREEMAVQMETARREEAAAQKREREALEARETALDDTHRMRRELEAMRRERDGLHAAREALRKRLTRLTQATDAAGRLETDLQRAQEDRDRLLREQTELAEKLQAARHEAGEWRARAEALPEDSADQAAKLEALEAELRAREGLEEAAEDLRRERDAARQMVMGLAEQARAVLGELETSRDSFGAEANGFIDLLREHLEGVVTLAGTVESAAHVAAERGEVADVSAIREEYEGIAGLYESARAEQGRLSVAFEATRGRLGRVEYELAKARKTQSLLVAEMESLRREAASQVATANIQAGELEHGISAVSGLLEHWRTQDDTLQDRDRLARDLTSAVHHLHDMADKVAVLKREIGASAGDDSYGDQPALFEHDIAPPSAHLTIQSLGDTLDALSEPGDMGPLSLADAVQQALSGDEPQGERP